MEHLTLPTLVLNKGWSPIAVATVRRSVVMVSVDSARFMDSNTYSLHSLDEWLELDIPEGNDFIVLSCDKKMRVPEIVVTANYDKYPEREVKLTRRNLMVRDRFTCMYTGKKVSAKEATIDHIHPQSRGGRTTWENVVISSGDANRKKADRTLKEAGMKLLTVPKKPEWNPIYSRFARMSSTSSLPASWQKFLPKKWNIDTYLDVEI